MRSYVGNNGYESFAAHGKHGEIKHILTAVDIEIGFAQEVRNERKIPAGLQGCS